MAQLSQINAVKEQAASSKGVPARTESSPAAPVAVTRACPTRADGGAALFQHRVTVSQCQSKQRGLYHKCFTCAHANGRG